MRLLLGQRRFGRNGRAAVATSFFGRRILGGARWFHPWKQRYQLEPDLGACRSAPHSTGEQEARSVRPGADRGRTCIRQLLPRFVRSNDKRNFVCAGCRWRNRRGYQPALARAPRPSGVPIHATAEQRRQRATRYPAFGWNSVSSLPQLVEKLIDSCIRDDWVRVNRSFLKQLFGSVLGFCPLVTPSQGDEGITIKTVLPSIHLESLCAIFRCKVSSWRSISKTADPVQHR